jgi:hypothetical protein
MNHEATDKGNKGTQVIPDRKTATAKGALNRKGKKGGKKIRVMKGTPLTIGVQINQVTSSSVRIVASTNRPVSILAGIAELNGDENDPTEQVPGDRVSGPLGAFTGFTINFLGMNSHTDYTIHVFAVDGGANVGHTSVPVTTS